ncbi:MULTISPECIES: extracellular solute-binding protein [Clostridium]|uniref:Extracellular solute-binding protein n=1 Tax=Clostridium cibarium TaxID=2762247 RepID=A0ABR8PSX3_9CLOT|nr:MULTISPECIES: extracellular solute-binding protein [Clostridium]MBD7911268.1 extracellular solute-binding protein [Clostridium cibarium]
MKKSSKSIKFICLILLIIAVLISVVIALNKKRSSSEAKSYLEGSITFLSNRTDKREELKALTEEFELEYPKVKVNLELKGDAEEILQRKASVSELPDVTLVPSVISSKEFKDYFLPLDDLGFKGDDIYDYNVGMGDDGYLYNLTTCVNWQGVIYNKSIFNDAGISELPKTKEDFLKCCTKLKSIGVTPIAINYKQSWAMNIWMDIIPYLFDTNLENNIITKSNDILGDNSGVYKSLEFIRSIVKDGYCEDELLNYDWEQCKKDIKNGKIAMIIWSSDFKNQLEDIGMDKKIIDMFPIPESKVIKVVGDYRFGVSRNSQHPNVAKEFLKFIFQEDRYAKAVNITSTIKRSKETISMIKSLEKFNMPIEIQGDVIRKQTVEEAEIHDKYFNNRKTTGLDAKFVQKYVIDSDSNITRNEINKEWKSFK